MPELTDQDLSIYSDLHKDVFGSRPRFGLPETLAEYRREMDRLGGMLEAQQAEEEAEARALGFASHRVYFEHWSAQFELEMDLEAFGPSARGCLIPKGHWDGPRVVPGPDLPSVSSCRRAIQAEDAWYAGETS